MFKNRGILAVVLPCIGVLILPSCQSEEIDEPSSSSTVSFSSVASFAGLRGKDPWPVRELQRTKEFLFICNHLDDILSRERVDLSGTLGLLVWRAAFQIGTREQAAKAFEACLRSRQPGHDTYTYLVRDLAEDPILRDCLLFQSGISAGAVVVFLTAVADQAPDSYGPSDYTPVLADLMRNSHDASIRGSAAFAIARWNGVSALGSESQQVLSDLASRGDCMARIHIDILRVLGTYGWQRPPTSTTSPSHGE